MKTRTQRNSMIKFITELYSNHSPDLVISIIEDGYAKGLSTSRIRDNIESTLSIKIPRRFIKPIFDEWHPGTFDMLKTDRRDWFATKWPIQRLEDHKWAQLYDAAHPVYKYFTRKNLVNYHGQKSMALKRGLKFELDFLSWVVWWISTGHFDERGVYNYNYQMCRKGDTGDYTWDNIYCATGEENKNAFHSKNYEQA